MRLEDALEKLSFLRDHLVDLRDPLRAINGFSHVILDDARERLTDEDKQHLRRVVEASHRISEEIDRLVERSRG